jgi:hypothetical protein
VSKLLLEDLFQAYFDARKNKRNTVNALEFEFNLEENIFQLHQDIINRKYDLKPSICFINQYPVKREIFAADFRDRVVHHFIYNYIYEIFDNSFIYDSYSCRKEKGTLLGIKRLNHFIRSCSENYHQDCYILKLDISGYFMNIDKNILWKKVRRVLIQNRSKVTRIDYKLLLALIEKTIFNNPTKNCKVKGKRKDWVGLPKNKSLFFSKRSCGLPIGNLTSQLFSNIYLNDFDWFVKKELDCKFYGRYVDDFFIVSKDKEFLRKIIPQIKKYLQKELNLTIHPNKIYLQHFSKGVGFLGSYLKPYRIYIKNKIKTNFNQVINDWNEKALEKDFNFSKEEILDFITKTNSYLGLLSHFKTKRLRQKMVDRIEIKSYNYFYLNDFSNKCLKPRGFCLKRMNFSVE